MTNKCLLGDVCDIIAGQSPSSQFYNSDGVGLPFFQGKADFGELYPKVRIWCSKPIKIAEPGDILISVRAPVGPTNLADKRSCIGRGLAAIRPQKNIDTGFLLSYLRYIEPQLSQTGRGSTFAAITIKELRAIEIPLPPLPEQRRIAAVLDAAGALRAKRRAALAKLDALLQSVFLEMFGDPVKNEKGWEEVKLGKVVDYVGSGVTPLGGSSVYGTDGHLFIRSQNVLMFDFDFSDAAFINESIHEDMRRTWIKQNDVLLNITGASIGRINYYKGEDDIANVNQHVCIIRPKTRQILPSFLTYHLGMPTYQNKIIGQNAGATRQAFTFKQIREFSLILPPIPLQAKFNTSVEKVIHLRDWQRRADITLGGFFNSLQQRAFRGELFPLESGK